MTARIDPIIDLDDINSNWDNTDAVNGIFQSDEVYIDADSKIFYFKAEGNFAAAGSGVTGQALYSFFKDRWKNDPNLPQYEFPMLSITNEQFEFINGWKMDDTQVVAQSGEFNTTTRKMIRTAGWSETEVDGTVSRRYFGFVSLGTLADTDAPYYVQDSSYTATTVGTVYTGTVNEAIQFYGNIDAAAGSDTAADDFIGEALVTGITGASIVVSTKTVTSTSHGLAVGDVIKVSSATGPAINGFYIVGSVTTNTFVIRDTLPTGATNQSDLVIDQVGFDRSQYFKAFVRTRGKTYSESDLGAIGVSETTYIVYRFPITNANDLNINTTSDVAFIGASIQTIVGNGTSATLTASAAHGLYVGAPITISGTTSFNGDFVVTGISGTLDAEEILTFASTTSASDGAAGTVILGYTDRIDIEYLANPQTGIGDVNITGDYAISTTYALGDVAFDIGNSKADVDGPQWYYVSATTGASNGADMDADSNNTWTKWNAGQRDIEQNGTWSAYTTVLDLNNGGTTPLATKEVAYEWSQYKLRSNTGTIDVGTSRKGSIASTIVYFVGSQLHTYADANIPFAVVIDDIAGVDVNSITYHDYVDALHFSPTVVLVTFNFNNNLSNDSDAVFYAYYTTGVGTEAGNDFGTTGALQLVQVVGAVESNVGAEISNNVPNNGVYTFNYAYTADTTNGRSGGDVPITVVAIGLGTGQYVVTTGTITSAGATVSLVAPLERNYTNPV